VRSLPWIALAVVVVAGALVLINMVADDGTDAPATPATDIVEANRTGPLPS
jgi:hypothetical protein